MHEEYEEHEEPQLPAEERMHTQAELDVLCNQDLLKLLFEKLGRLALCSAGATCRQWRQVAASDEFWTSLDFSGLGVTPWQVFACDYRTIQLHALQKYMCITCKTLLCCSFQHLLLLHKVSGGNADGPAAATSPKHTGVELERHPCGCLAASAGSA